MSGLCSSKSPSMDVPCTLPAGHVQLGQQHHNTKVGIVWPILADPAAGVPPPPEAQLDFTRAPLDGPFMEWFRRQAQIEGSPLPGLTGVGHPSGLASWWRQQAEVEIEKTVPKAEEYGSTDLIKIGQTLAESMGREVTDAEAAELGVYFYLVGKLARWTDAVTRGDQVSDDTLFDLGVYVRMVQRIRESGGWPSGNKEARA